MPKAYSQLTWGFILILLDIHLFVIDILPDPVGYFLIYQGLELLEHIYGKKNHSKLIALMLIIVSIPTVVMDQTKMNAFGIGSQLSGWRIYTDVLGLMQVVLIFYVFLILIKVVKEMSDHQLLQQTNNTFKWYMGIMLSITFLQPFLMNMFGAVTTTIVVISAVSYLLVNVFFLVLLHKFKKSGEHERAELLDQ